LSLLRFLKANPIAACLLLVAAASAVFLVFPGIDLWFSDLFYRSRGGFWMRRNDVLGFFRGTNDVLIAAVVVVLIASVAVKLARPEKPSPVPPNIVAFLLSTLVLGPLLLVNVILKNTWGRPRPVQVDAFGGAAPYVEVWRITDWCDTNCSFVAGEASSAAWLVAAALVLPRSARPAAVGIALAYALLISLNRIAFGGHFLSDVVISFGLTLLLVAIVHRVVIERPPKWLSNQALEDGLTRLGRAVRGERSRAGTK
jgi:membrane-associated PAP2 superfamily phosphatase